MTTPLCFGTHWAGGYIFLILTAVNMKLNEFLQ
jgi:hypothetical protein